MTTGAAPRRRNARARLAPATPAPMIATRGVLSGSGTDASGDANRPSSRCFLPPKPGAFWTSKPTPASPRRTAPATLKVATRAPALDRAAIRDSTSGRHICGFLAGEKPSRNQASADPLQASSAASASWIARSRITPICGHSILWKPRRPPGHCRTRISARSVSAGHAARARAASSRPIGKASMEKMCKVACGRDRSRRQRSARARTFSPVPKPSSPTTNRRRPRQASGRPHP